ncbi:hypothetical protein SLEP1_g6886 [Rubroshorea leprosula]|uniref:Uncharacterized protein n=1 Tax=Rubroshorea leprosula TaxID=152421 RepID=A0AAV5I182_9ROSI|nr:hypothetical protein SLEP1_g6886 [Rubroshorea leprosula]
MAWSHGESVRVPIRPRWPRNLDTAFLILFSPRSVPWASDRRLVEGLSGTGRRVGHMADLCSRSADWCSRAQCRRLASD